MTVIIYIYLYREKFEVVWEPNGWKYRKTKKHVFNTFGLSIFFVEETFLYLLQGSRKTAFVENIYTCSRLRERQTASNIEKRWNTWTDFLHFLPFLWQTFCAISYRVTAKRHLKYPKKSKKSGKKQLINENFEKKIGFLFSFFYPSCEFQKKCHSWRVYIFSTKAVLRPPCRRYRDVSSTKKIDNPKLLDTCFRVFRYLKLFGAHATSNVCIYFQKKLFYGHPVGDTEVAPLQKR